jgi:uncharacterized protein YkwD
MTRLSRHSRRHVFQVIAAGALSLPAHRILPAAAVDAIDYCPSTEERAFLKRINAFRGTHGLAPLQLSQTLGAASRHHSADMAARNYFSHQTPEEDSPGTRAVAHGYPSSSVGENIAAGSESAAATFGQWENSSGHRSNMLGSTYQAIGIGRAQGGSYGWYWTTVFGGTFDVASSCDGGGTNPPPPPSPSPVPPTLTPVADPIPAASTDKKRKKHKKRRRAGNKKGNGNSPRHRH